jgi:peroxiredoxin
MLVLLFLSVPLRNSVNDLVSPGTLAPDFTLPDIDGGSFTLSTQRGTVILLDFFFIECGWCEVALPDVKQLLADFPNGFRIVSITIELGDTEAKLKQYRTDEGITWTILRDTQQIYSSGYGVTGAPTFYVIDASGVVRFVKVGGIDVYAILRPQIASLIDLRPVTQLTAQLSATTVEVGSTVTVSGSITPTIGGGAVSIRVVKPDSSMANLSVATGSGGSYSGSFLADREGSWKVKAFFAGDAGHQPSESTELDLVVKPSTPWLLIGAGAVVLALIAAAVWYFMLRKPPRPGQPLPPPPPPPPAAMGSFEVPPAPVPTRSSQLLRSAATLTPVALLGAFAVAIVFGADQYVWIQVYVRVLCTTCIGIG